MGAKYIINQGGIEIKSRILDELERIEKDNDVTVLYACESGSRAWGFSNAESDYDVRFVYKMNSSRQYVSISQKSDVIEMMDDELDIVGWDVKKALYLHYKSNPNLREWIISPIVYLPWRDDIFRGLPDFDSAVLKFHYTSIAFNNWKILKDNPETTKKVLKMYLYNCRCILVWMVINEDKDPHINIYELLNQAESLDASVKGDINGLISHYRNGCRDSLDLKVLQRINEWMGECISSMRKESPERDAKPDLKAYDDRLFDIAFSDYKM